MYGISPYNEYILNSNKIHPSKSERLLESPSLNSFKPLKLSMGNDKSEKYLS